MNVASTPEESQNEVTREVSAFLRELLERAGSSSLRDAAMGLYPGGLAAGTAKETLRHVLCVAVAVLCDSASVRLTSEPAPLPSSAAKGPAEIVQLAARAITAIERASAQELAEAHSYFLASPLSRGLAERRPLLAELSFGVVRIMIDYARLWGSDNLLKSLDLECDVATGRTEPPWPEIAAFEEFLQNAGLTWLCREADHEFGKLLQYGNAAVAVRLTFNEGAWLVEVADIRSQPVRWYDLVTLTDFLSGAREDDLSVEEQIDILRAKWPEILRAFDPIRQADTHMRLAYLRLRLRAANRGRKGVTMKRPRE